MAMPAETESGTEFTIPELTMGMRMRLARLKAGITLHQIAEEFGVSQPTVSNWENDKKLPRQDLRRVVIRWAELTRTPRDWILWGVVTQRYAGLPGQSLFSVPSLENDMSGPEQLTLPVNRTLALFS